MIRPGTFFDPKVKKKIRKFPTLPPKKDVIINCTFPYQQVFNYKLLKKSASPDNPTKNPPKHRGIH